MLLRIASLILVSCWTIPCLAGEQVCPKAHAGVALRQGIRLLAENKYAEAQREFLAATQTDPASAEAFFYLAMAELRLGNAPDAERSLRQSLRLNPRSVNTLYNLGVLLLDGKKPAEALSYLSTAKALGPASPELSVNLVRAYLEVGKRDAAFELAESSARRFENVPAFYLALGKCFLSHDLPAEARKALERADRLAPAQAEVILPLADSCLRERDASAARKALESLASSARNSAGYHNLLARSWFLSGEKEPALREMNLAVQLEPRNPVYALTLGRYYQKYGDQQSALRVLEGAATLAPDLPDIPYSLAVSYFIADDFDQAANLVSRAINLDPAFDRAIFLLAICRFAQARSQQAETLFTRAIELKPRNAYYRCFYGMKLASENRLSEALPQFQTAVALDPSYALAHYQVGRALSRQDLYAQARAELEKSVALEPDFPEAYYLLGRVYSRLGEKGKAEEAVATFQKYRAAEYTDRQEVMRHAAEAIQGER